MTDQNPSVSAVEEARQTLHAWLPDDLIAPEAAHEAFDHDIDVLTARIRAEERQQVEALVAAARAHGFGLDSGSFRSAGSRLP